MAEFTYIQVDVLYWIIQDITGSGSGDNVTIEIRRLSDNYTWHFTDLAFKSGNNSGTMTFVNDIDWKASFTPDEEDTYIITITDVTLGTAFKQVLKAVGGDDAFAFSFKAEVTIANIALNALGEARINSLDEDSERATKIKAVFPYVRDEVLRSAPWNFAIGRCEPALLSETPLFEYSCYHQLPSNCLRVLTVYDSGGEKLVDEKGDPLWRREGDKIASDESSIFVKYIKRVTDANQYDAHFITLFGWRLACEVAFAITANKGLMVDMSKVYKEDKLPIAESIDSQESSSMDIVGDTEWEESRQ